jgi:hypothetical protein
MSDMATTSTAFLRSVGSRRTDSSVPRFVARIRWRSEVDPDWEIDTRHPGFETWRQAAFFANGLSEDGASILSLRNGAFLLKLANGRDIVIDRQEIVIWQGAKPNDSGVPEDLSFVQASAAPTDLSAMGLDGSFSAARFGVDEDGSSSRMDVRVEADAQRRAVLVSLVLLSEDDETEVPFFERFFVNPAKA